MDGHAIIERFICHSKKIYETELHKCLSEGFEPIFISPHLFSFSCFRDQTTAQSVLILRMVQTVWRNAPTAYRELTVSFSSMRIRIGNATHAIQTAPKGKHPFWPRAKPWTCFQLKRWTYLSVSVMMSTCIAIASRNAFHLYNLHVDFKWYSF